MNIKWISTTPEKQWIEKKIDSCNKNDDTLIITGELGQSIDGFGGCFNELGWIALSKAKETERNKVFAELFDPKGSCRFNFCRMPMGANDYAKDWYSYNENDEDYGMEKFSIGRDYQYLIPYIKKAMEHQPQLELFASPWSPPTWMKFPKAYNYGRLRMEQDVLEAYALYFKKFVEAYTKEGIKIRQVHIQNEPFADQKFPSCLWSGEQFRIFIKDYLGPLFKKAGMDTEIWFGTLNGPTQMNFGPTGAIGLDLYDKYVDEVLFDEEARKYIKGVGYQWAGQHVIQRTHESFPELKLMQTENECGDGENTWEYAKYMYNLMRHYLSNGVNSYIYWNMVLEPKGRSTWGWTQNSLITVDPTLGEVIYNPEFYIMKHFSHFVERGAVRLQTKGHWSGASVAFKNPDGTIVVVVSNWLERPRSFTFVKDGQEVSIELEPNSINTLVID